MTRVATPGSEAERLEALYTWWKPAQAAKALGGMHESSVRALIRSGHLKAFNAARPDAKRPDWRTTPEWVDEYRRKRMNAA